MSGRKVTHEIKLPLSLTIILGVIAFALVLSHEESSIFSHYGFFIVVSALCWIGALLIIFFHVVGCCKVKILGVWQREYSLVSVQ